MLLDYVDLVVHVQHAEEREYYSLERLWRDCPPLHAAAPPRARDSGSVVSGRRIVVVRHGRTAYNHEDRWQGQLDIPLDDVGRHQAAVMAPEVGSLTRSRSSPVTCRARRDRARDRATTGLTVPRTSGCGRSTPGSGRG